MNFDNYKVVPSDIETTDLIESVRSSQLIAGKIFSVGWGVAQFECDKERSIIYFQPVCQVVLMPPRLIHQYMLRATSVYSVYCDNKDLLQDIENKIISHKSLTYLAGFITNLINRAVIELWTKSESFPDIQLDRTDVADSIISESDLNNLRNHLLELLP